MRFDSQLSCMNCQMVSTGLSSGHLAGNGTMLMLAGTLRRPTHIHPKHGDVGARSV
jgi:hypothetical protein